MIDWITTHYAELFSGLYLTLELMICALCLGLILAIIFSSLLLTQQRLLCWPINAFVFILRGSPLLVQMYIIYYAAPELTFIRETFLWSFFQHPFACAVLALTLNSAAYTTVLLSGALKNVPRGEIQAAHALNFPRLLTLRRIILPHALLTMWPAYANEVILILKATTLASTITLLDLMGITRQIIAQTYDPITGFLVAGLFYCCLTVLIMGSFKWVEYRFLSHS